MIDGLHGVWRAAEMLAGGESGLRTRLKAARVPLTSALRHPDVWPAGLLHQARSIERLLREEPTCDPLDVLDPGLARQLAEDILALAADVAHYAEGKRLGGTPPALAISS